MGDAHRLNPFRAYCGEDSTGLLLLRNSGKLCPCVLRIGDFPGVFRCEIFKPQCFLPFQLCVSHKVVRGPAPLSLALAHVEETDGKVVLKEW